MGFKCGSLTPSPLPLGPGQPPAPENPGPRQASEREPALMETAGPRGLARGRGGCRGKGASRGACKAKASAPVTPGKPSTRSLGLPICEASGVGTGCSCSPAVSPRPQTCPGASRRQRPGQHRDPPRTRARHLAEPSGAGVSCLTWARPEPRAQAELGVCPEGSALLQTRWLQILPSPGQRSYFKTSGMYGPHSGYPAGPVGATRDSRSRAPRWAQRLKINKL